MRAPSLRRWRAPQAGLGSYGMLAVLLLLAALFSLLTLREQEPTGERAARALAARLAGRAAEAGPVLIAVRPGEEEARFAAALAERLRRAGWAVEATLAGEPAALRAGLAALPPAAGPRRIATVASTAPALRAIVGELPPLAGTEILTAPSYRWPTFLLRDNLRNVANQIAVIAMVAVGMTLVILTGGIDLSVGSLIALAAVVVTGIVAHSGAEAAGAGTVLLAGLAAVLLCGLAGALSGLTITRFGVPPFIATLAMMQVASGVAYILSQGRPIYQVPANFTALGRAADPLVGLPYAVWLMAALFAIAHLVMSRTVLGRHVYAVGGNPEAARLAGVRVGGILLLVYTLSGALAGLGGIVMASQLKSGAPTYGLMYELYVIAAVVVGGTSLSGGEGKVLGTLIGAFIIAVIQNGMNLTNVESYAQKVVLGLVILGAVLLDRLKHLDWWTRRAARAARGEESR